MRITLRTALPALAVLGVTAGVVFAIPGLPQALDVDVWNLPALDAQIDREHKRSAELAACTEQVLRRIRLKEGLLDDLLAGATGFRETAGQFLAANRATPRTLDVMRLTYRAGSDEERAGLQVVNYLEGRLGSDPRVTRELLRRLRDEIACWSEEAPPPV